ncbi:TM2 domain-containing protein [Arthrobacter sp. zg-Y877]|uniref:TM2 domain-containing protein n=1 Tax=Arthrobacter sp. zg-Y877 TaxID=3049074 RepID=UPI0025A38A91|nr:TM2 domain-containing protein [Arthrobacter sp. zg-Y877]MDM7989471.1 NINE protein [Arthrobacter sp. zg-Y877]
MSGNGPYPGNNHDNHGEPDDWDGQYAYPKKAEPAPRPTPPQQQSPGYQDRPAQYPGSGQGYPGQQAQGYPNQQVQGYPNQQQHAPGQGYHQSGYRHPQQGQQKSRLVAGLLGVFLGGFGVHRFYLGNNGVGIAQVVLTCFTGLGAVWGFVEGVMILANARTFRTDAQGIPLK